MAAGHVTSSQVGFGVTAVGGVFATIVGVAAPSGSDLANNNLFLASVALALAGLAWLICTGFHAGFVWFRDRDRPPQPPVPKSPVVHAKSVPGRTYIKTGIWALNRIITGNTGPQAEVMIAPYMGKWMTVSGKLDEVVPLQHPMGDKWYKVEFKVTGFLNRRPIQMNFESEWGDYLESVRRGTRMRVNGNIVSVPRWGIVLGDCELA